MMLPCKIIKVSFLWIPYLLLLPFLHIGKVIFYIFLVLSIHEMAHIACATFFHYPIQQVRIYPFGIAAQIGYIGFGNIIQEVCMIASGPLMHMLFPFLFRSLYTMGYISSSFLDYLYMMNASILIFNLLPLYPLDGGRLLQAFFHSFLPFKRAQQATYVISIVCVCWLLYFRVLQGVGGCLVLLLFVFEIGIAWKDIGFQQLQFYYYRYMHKVNYPIIMNQHHDLYRGRYNIMRVNKGWIEEEKWLAKYFNNKNRGSEKE